MSDHSETRFIPGELVDTNVDLVVVKIPLPSGVTVTEATINVINNFGSGNSVVEIRDEPDGAGNVITLTVTAGTYYAEGTGTLLGSASGYFYIRNVTPNGLQDANVSLNYTR